jgi:hypothetical protein
MTNARQILEEFTARRSWTRRRLRNVLLQDGAFEMPYLDSLGFPWRYGNNIKISPRKRACRQLCD